MRGYSNCKFCFGRGCLACEGEMEKDKKRDEERRKYSFENPLVVVKGGPNEDPVGWEILQGLNAKRVNTAFDYAQGDPNIANVFLEITFLLHKENILRREAEIERLDLEHAVARFEGEGGPCAA